MATLNAPVEVPEHVEAQRKTKCPNNVLLAIYGNVEDKKKAYDHSLTRWWAEYSDRKNDEEDEHVSDSLLYDRNHLPRSAPPPECVHEARALQRELDIPQGLLDKPGIDLSGMPTPSTDDQLGGGEREGSKITGGGAFRVLLLQSDKHTEQLVVKAITTAIPGTSTEHALNCFNTAERLGQAIITSCIKEVAEFYNEQLLRQGVSSKIEPDTTTF